MTPFLRTYLEQDSHLKHLFLNHHAIISSQSGTSSWLVCSLKVGAHWFISTIVGLRHDGCGPTEWEAQWQQHGALSWVVPPSPIVMLNPYTIAKIRKPWFSRGMNGMFFHDFHVWILLGSSRGIFKQKKRHEMKSLTSFVFASWISW